MNRAETSENRRPFLESADRMFLPHIHNYSVCSFFRIKYSNTVVAKKDTQNSTIVTEKKREGEAKRVETQTR